MKRVVLAVILATFIATSGFSVALAKPAAPAPKDIAKVVFIHYKAPGKPPWAAPGKPKPDEGYALFRGGVKWADEALPVKYLINKGSVPGGIDRVVAVDEIKAAFEEWDDNTLINDDNQGLYADGIKTTTELPQDIRDGKNIIAWVYIDNPKIIARTTFWYYVNTKELVEFDIEFNSRFDWGINGVIPAEANTVVQGDTSFMDIRNIATHEAGHTLVLGDLYQGQYAQMTMYGYSDKGEVKKISLESGDIAGLQKLYGK
jgi:hypothetical protein